MTGWANPQALDGATWRRAHATLMGETAREFVFAPHNKLVYQQAFDRVRAGILAGRPLRPPCPYTFLRHRPGKNTFSERADGVLGPVERTLFQLFAAAAAQAAEPHLDRDRVFSSLPARTGEDALLASTDWSANCFRLATQQAAEDERWSHFVEIDVARAGTSLRRADLLASLARLGLPAAWLAEGERIDRAFEKTLGPAGLLNDLMTSGTLVTIHLRPLDRLCAELGRPSFRLIDGVLMPTEDIAAADAAMARLTALLAAMGMSPNPDKTRIVARTDLLVQWASPANLWVEPGSSEAQHLAAREMMADLGRYGYDAFKVEQWALLALGRAGDRSALDRALSRFVDVPWAARIYALYIGLFLDDRAVRDRFEAALHAAASRLHPWQWMWAASALWKAPAIAGRTAPLLARIAGDGRLPDTTRAAAAIVLARFATAGGWEMLESLASGARSSHLRAAIAFGFRYRPAAVRQTTLAAWARLDPHVDLVATAVARDLAAPPGMAGAEAGA
ncbi:hypothetical protein STHU_54390 [Allostella humosa]|uniref:hypothetical protein n=1 Tax=Stella humosa TaxID=94 RepID=UPI00113E28DB|nr:hypothetical protein [Stella humosa]BBK34805.1 hypothetical protein STHU_54390 [Stella humosa]